MDELTQFLALKDGVTAPLRNMNRAVEELYDSQEEAAQAVSRLEGQLNGLGSTASRTGGLMSEVSSGLKGMVGQFAIGNIAANLFMSAADFVAQLPGKIMKASDAYSGMMARLNLVTGSEQEAAEMNERIYQSALRARGSFDGMADSVSKIAMTAKAAFPDPREVVPFVEGIQKLFAIGGTGIQQQADAMLQLTQALGSGKLQGDEFRSIAEAAPLIEKMVAQQLGVTQGELKQLSSQGVITADILRDSILSNMDEINADFAKMPLTWGQAWQQMGTIASHGMQPAYDALKGLVNGGWVQSFMNGFSFVMPLIGQLLADAVNGIVWLGQTAVSVGSYIGDWLSAGFILVGNVVETLFPVLFAGLAMWAGYEVALNVETAVGLGLKAAEASWTYITAAAHSAAALATKGQAAAAALLNAVLNANPIMWVARLVLLAVGAFAAWQASTLGLRTTIAEAFQFIANIAESVINFVIGKINGLIGAVNGAAKYLNKIPGVNIPFIPTIEWKAENWGGKAYDAVQNFDASQIVSAVTGADLPDIGNYSPGGGYAPAPASGIGGSEEGPAAKETAGNTKGILDAMGIMDEDIKFFRDAAEQEVINRYTTASVNINLENTNNITNDVDAEGMVTHLIDQLAEAELAGAEAVHI